MANTGAALRHIHENVFNTEFDRPDARNVIFYFTDRKSTDDVREAARMLRESGVMVSCRLYSLLLQRGRLK